MIIVLIIIFINSIINPASSTVNKEEIVIRTIAMFPITNQSYNKEYNYLTYTIRDALKAQLIQSNQFLFSKFSELDKELEKINFNNKTLINLKTAINIASNLKAHAVILGKFEIIAENIIIQIDAFDITLNKTISSTSIKGDVGLDIFRIADNVSISMAEKLTKKKIIFGHFSENFDAVAPGEIPIGWLINNINEKSEIGTVNELADQPVSAPNCLKIYDGSRTGGAVITINIQENNYGQLRFNIKLASSAYLSRVGVVLKDSLSKDIINFSMDEYSFLRILNPDRTAVNFINYAGNRWYACQINWDLTTGYYKISIDNADYGVYPLINPEKINRIQFFSGSTPDSAYFDSTAYIDNVVYTIDAISINKP